MCLARLHIFQKSSFFLPVSGSNAATTSNIGAICHTEVTSLPLRNPNSWPKISALFFASFDSNCGCRYQYSATIHAFVSVTGLASANLYNIVVRADFLNKDDFRT